MSRRKYDHDFLVDVLCKVSVQFKRVATDSSLWKGCVNIWMQNGSAYGTGWGYGVGKDDFVVEECVNIGTREITMLACGMKVANICFHTGLALGRRFPNTPIRNGCRGDVAIMSSTAEKMKTSMMSRAPNGPAKFKDCGPGLLDIKDL